MSGYLHELWWALGVYVSMFVALAAVVWAFRVTRRLRRESRGRAVVRAAVDRAWEEVGGETVDVHARLMQAQTQPIPYLPVQRHRDRQS